MNVVLGFVLLLLLGFAASRLALFQGRLSLGTQYLFMAGTEFLLIGLIAGPQMANILTQDALRQLSPVLSLVLGWIGLLIGLQFQRRELVRIPSMIWWMGLIISAGAFCLCFLGLKLGTPWFFHRLGFPIENAQQEKDLGSAITSLSFLLAWIGTVSTSSALVLLKRHTDARGEATRLIQLLTEVRSPLAITAMGLWFCLNHLSMIQYSSLEIWFSRHLANFEVDEGLGAWGMMITPVMSGLEWVVLTVFLGVALGWMLHYLTNHRLGENEMLLLLAGSVILSGGLSSYLHLSPLFVNLIMGVTLANLPNFTRGRIIAWMGATEKPFFVIFMILVGAKWPSITPLVLGITAIYGLGRWIGLWLGGWLAGRWFLPHSSRIPNRLGLAMLPQGGVALAMVMDFALIHPGASADIALGVIILAILSQQIIGPSIMAFVLRSLGDLEGNRRAEPESNSVSSSESITPRMRKDRSA